MARTACGQGQVARERTQLQDATGYDVMCMCMRQDAARRAGAPPRRLTSSWGCARPRTWMLSCQGAKARAPRRRSLRLGWRSWGHFGGGECCGGVRGVAPTAPRHSLMAARCTYVLYVRARFVSICVSDSVQYDELSDCVCEPESESVSESAIGSGVWSSPECVRDLGVRNEVTQSRQSVGERGE